MRSTLKYLLLFAGAFALHPPPLHAQQGTSRPSFSAPTAASLGRFGEVPVSLATGSPDISVPLFTAQGRTLQLPVSLRYQSGGIRLDDIGSWVGLGWALEAGGTITRSVRGLPDDAYNGYWNTGHTWYKTANWPIPQPGMYQYMLFDNVREGFVDGEPDQFFFNFAGRTGQFVIGPTDSTSTRKEVRSIPHQDLDIRPANNFTAWIVTTEDGTRYTFAAADSTHDLSGVPSSDFVNVYKPPFISSWHLTEVRSPAGDVIRLHYTKYTARHRLTDSGGRVTNLNNACNTNTSNQISDFNMVVEQEFTTNRLDSITSAAHTIRFVPDAVLRADALAQGGARQEPRLARIVVATPTGTVIRQFEFEHDYFGGNRLRLKNLYEEDAAGNRLPPWSFTYDPQSFPARGSFAQDHNGYWNGKPNGSLVPAADGSYTWFDGTHTLHMDGADRSPDPAYARVGSLTGITYPTGGATTLVWEGHDYGRTVYGDSEYDAEGPEKSEFATSVTYAPTRVDTTAFVVGGTLGSAVSLDVSLYCTQGMTSCPSARVTGPGADQTYTTAGVRSLALAPGTYLLIATTPVSTQFATVTVTAKWRDRVHVVGLKPAGGLRIAEMRTSDGNGVQKVEKYRYRLLSDSTRSSGVMPYEPVYLEHLFTGDPNYACEYFSRTAASVTPLGASATVGYREVTVLHGESGEFGKTRETFRNPIDTPDGAPQVMQPNMRMTSYEFRHGHPLSATEYNSAGQPQQRVAQRYTFQFGDPATSRRFHGMSLSHFDAPTGYVGGGEDGLLLDFHYQFMSFEVVSEWYFQSSDTTYVYDETGASSVSTTRTHAYENPAHLQETQLTETTSDGKQRITRMRYPGDYPSVPISSDPDGLADGEAYAYALTIMKDSAHIHSPVIERWTSEVVGGTERVLQAELNTYIPFPTAAYRTMLPLWRLAFAAPGPVTDFTPASVQGTGLVWDESRYQVAEQINGYDDWGRTREVSDPAGATITYTYGGNANNAYLTRIRRASPDGPALTTDVSYDASGNVATVVDEGGVQRNYTFDGFGRLRQVRNAAGTPLKGYAYTYSRTAGNGWTYQPGAPNAVVDSTYLQTSPSVAAVVGTGYLDGLGRPVQSVVQDGTNYQVAARQYDASGHTWRIWKPFTRAAAGFDSNFSADATAFYNTDLGVTSAQPHADSLFTPDALRRPKTIVPEYLGSAPTVWVTLAYGIDAATGRRYVETTDEAGKKSRVFQDGFGSGVTTVLGYGAAEATTTQLAVNALGQRTQLTDPRGIVTTYTVDTRGRVTARANPDAGNRSQKFDPAGNLRFSQSATQAAAGKVGFTTYDYVSRPLVSGEGSATFSALEAGPGSVNAVEANNANWLTVRAYDAKPSTSAFPWSLFAAQFGSLALSNTQSRLAAVASKSNGAWQAEFYSYDADGRLATRYTFTQANGGGGVLAALNTTVGYTRDLRDAVTQRAVTVGSSTFNHWYDYDGRGLLARVYASTSAGKPATADAAYTYRPGGRVSQRQFQGGPLTPIRYTIREQMERIGDPASTAYPFSARYSYQPNGRLQEAEFYNAGSPSADKRYGWVFGTASWDALNRLKSADYSAWAGTGWNTTAANDLTGIGYDAAGNLTALGRYQQTGAVIDNLAYGYGATSNRLVSVADAQGATAETWDAETGTFTYDANGNVKTAPAPYNITAATYDPQNLPLTFTANGVTSSYRYDGGGQRIARQVGAGNTDYYLKEGATTLGVMTVNTAGSPTSWHFNLLAGDQVVGRQTSTGSRRYYHRDMLGSTRAVTENGVVVESYDYDPWGVLMPGRTLAGPTREGFTGKEQDAETGLTYFGARYYMAALGRWTSVDPPADEFPGWSPYNYVEDNPVGTTDPNGLCPPFDHVRSIMCGSGTSPEAQQYRRSMAAQAGHGIASSAGLQLIHTAANRRAYGAAVRDVPRTDRAARTALKEAFRESDSHLGRGITETLRPSTAPPPGSGGRANVTNEGWNSSADAAGKVGTALLVVSTAVSVYQIANAEDHYRETVVQGFGFLGALGGGSVGGTAGSALAPGPGTVIGTLGGAAAGQHYGEKFGGWLYDAINP